MGSEKERKERPCLPDLWSSCSQVLLNALPAIVKKWLISVQKLTEGSVYIVKVSGKVCSGTLASNLAVLLDLI